MDVPGDHTAVSFHVKDLSLEQKLESLPTRPGVYQYKNAEGKVIYVKKGEKNYVALTDPEKQIFRTIH